jgi:uncharacterized delta-60 repeat protein
MTLQSDKKIILAGTVNMMDTSNFALARYNATGELDNSFSVDGIVTTDFGPYAEDAYSVALTAGGKIVLAGCSYNGPDFGLDYIIARYNSDGTLDLSFDEDGKVYSDFSESSDIAYSTCVQANGKIIVAGYIYDLMDFALIRYNTDGSPDNTFGEGGRVITDIDGAYNIAYCMIIQPDDKILVAGSNQYTSVDMDIVVVRYNPDGSLDNTFSIDGKVVTSFGEYTDLAKAIALQSDGKILVAGASDDGIDSDVVLVRYHSDGTLDLSFSEDGKVVTDIGCNSVCANALVIQPDKKIVVAGTADNSVDYDILLLRYNPDGSLDPTFGEDGIVITDIDDLNNEVASVALSEEGNIIVCGNSYSGSSDGSDIFIASYLSGLSLGIIDFSNSDHTLWIYPNPVCENAILEYELIKEETISIDLYDLQGKLVQNFISYEKRAAGINQESLNMNTSFPAGTYILSVSYNSGRRVVQISIRK